MLRGQAVKRRGGKRRRETEKTKEKGEGPNSSKSER
jgi:hypothetical protein